MSSNIVIIGAGFGGVWSALSARRLIDMKGKTETVKITVIAPEPRLAIRPRLYEADAHSMSHVLTPLFDVADICYLQGVAESIQIEAQTVTVRNNTGIVSTVSYDRLVLAAGSTVAKPSSIRGLDRYAFDIDSLESATKLEAHLKGLTFPQEIAADNTIVICGGSFTGIELATELPKRLGRTTNMRIVVVDSAEEIGSTLGPGPRPVITQAFEDLNIEMKLGSRVVSVDSEGVILASGERIASNTVVWTAGMKATPLTQDIPGDKDRFSRLFVDRTLRAASAENVFVTGDAACALADTVGHQTLMCCQHALSLGRVSGHNAAASLLQEPMVEFLQAAYNCCLDLGAWGTVISGGWDREIKLTGERAKRVKSYINQKLIYPPEDVRVAIEAANPVGPDPDELFEQLVQAVA